LAGKKVLVKQLAGGKIMVLGGQKRQDRLEYKELAWRPKSSRPARGMKAVNNRRYKPGPDHPYNRQGRADQAARARRKQNNKPLAA
jgi:hypothetical protein